MDGDMARAAGDMSAFAVIVVVAIILVVAISMYYITGFLNRVVNRAGKEPPGAECAMWLRARQEAYLQRNEGAGGVRGGVPPVNPATGAPYTRCEAAVAASLDAGDARRGTTGAKHVCPEVPTPPSPLLQDPYAYYVAGECA
jgi:hypothetical protein